LSPIEEVEVGGRRGEERKLGEWKRKKRGKEEEKKTTTAT